MEIGKHGKPIYKRVSRIGHGGQPWGFAMIWHDLRWKKWSIVGLCSPSNYMELQLVHPRTGEISIQRMKNWGSQWTMIYIMVL